MAKHEWRGSTPNPAPRRCSKPDCRNRHPCPEHYGWAPAHKKAKENPEYALPSNWKQLVAEVWRLAGGRCRKCGRPCGPNLIPGIVDHIVNRASGGTHDISNLQLLCQECHDFKTKRERREAQRKGGR